MHAAVAERRIADQILYTPLGVVVDKAATSVEVQGRHWSELGAMDSGSAKPHGDLRGIGGAVKVQLAGKVAAPAGIGASDEPGKLAKLSLLPIEIQMQWHLAECRSAPEAGFQTHHACLLKVQAYVGSGWLAAQTDAPLARILLPQREIGVDQ